MIKKLTPISLLAVLLFLIVPADKTSASSYEDGTYNITANALHIDKDEPSVAADYINEAAEVIVENGEMNLQVTVPKSEEFSLYSLKKQGDAETKEEDDNNLYYSFSLTEQDKENAMINVITSYEVPSMDLVHEDVEFRFQLEGLDKIKQASGNNKDHESEENSNNENEENINDDESVTNDESDSDDAAATISGNDSDEGKDGAKQENPKTGDEAPIILFTFILIISGVLLTRKLAVR
ncbi:MAG TPA: NEAT domain-containing protein [Pseudogracilibacillus sp.]|nr:NEAT domain-containing protein [Pseudogracilibacillus sp.]